jgi:hypothetical protein
MQVVANRAASWVPVFADSMVCNDQIDLVAERFDRVRPAASLIHCTSPGKHQAWIAVFGVNKHESNARVTVESAAAAVANWGGTRAEIS